MPVVVNVSDFNKTIEEYIISRIKERNPEIDTTANSPINDLLIGPLQSLLDPLIKLTNTIELMQNLDNAENMTEEELDEKGEGNYMIKRKPGDKASGQIVFSFKTISDTSNLMIPEGIICTTKDGLRFVVTESKTFTPEELYSMYNSSTYTYDVYIEVEAEDIGSQYNVGEGSVSIVENPFSTNLVSITNKISMIGGTDKESNVDYANRIKRFYITRQLGTKPGYSGIILENYSEVKDVYVVGFGDDMMTRDVATITMDGDSFTGHIGGKVDMYIKGHNVGVETLSLVSKSNRLVLSRLDSEVSKASIVVKNTKNLSASLSFTAVFGVDASGKTVLTVPKMNSSSVVMWDYGDSIQVSYNYTDASDGLVKSSTETFVIDYTEASLKVPVIEVLSITNTNTNTIYDLSQAGVYSIINDCPATYVGSSKEVSKIRITDSTVNNGEVLSAVYSYNETILNVDGMFNVDENRIVTTDIMIKAATPSYLYVGMKIKLKEGQLPDIVKETAVKNVIIDMFNNVGLGYRIEESDIIGRLYANETTSYFIEYIELPLLTFHKGANATEAYVAGIRDNTFIQLGKVEYPVINECRIQWI